MLNMQSYFVHEFDFKENEDPLTFDFPPPSPQKHADADEGSIMELLWHQGPVIRPLHADPFLTGCRDVGSSAETSQRRQHLMEEDEMATWLHQYQIEERGEINEQSSKGSSCCQQEAEERARVAEEAAAPPAVTTATTTSEFDAAGKVFDIGSAGDSGGCSARASEGKRKARTGRDSGCHQELDVGVEHGNKKKEVRTSRTRAAEVHNLSERRRRDKINEKMKALQELIPRCNKSDKASMLDDAIEYLKSLQLQVQMLSSMQYNMGHMMFPDMQRYMQTLGFMGMSMAMTSGGIQRPMMSFAPILPYSPVIATPPPNLQPQPVPSFHLANAVIPGQVRTEASNQQDAASNSINLMNPNMVQVPNFANPYHHFAPIHHFQDHILAKSGKIKGTDNTKD